MSTNPTDFPDRTRPHPTERFSPDAQSFDLTAAARALAAEPTPTHQGHRQKTLYRHGTTTLALFLFDQGATLKEHRTNGTIFIQTLQGHLTIHVNGQPHPLPPNHTLVLSPNTPHDVHATQPSQMLLTVSLTPAPDKP